MHDFAGGRIINPINPTRPYIKSPRDFMLRQETRDMITSFISHVSYLMSRKIAVQFFNGKL